mgnify:CR=1 FL=1
MDLLELKQFATPRQAEIIDAIVKHGTQAKAAKALGIDRRGLERTLKRARAAASRQGWSPDHDMIHIAPDTHLVKGVSTFYDENGNPIRQWVKTDLKKDSLVADLQGVADGLSQELPKYKPLPFKPDKGVKERLATVIIGDAHIGMLVKRNYGGGDWDLEIAEKVTLQAIKTLITNCGEGTEFLLLNVGDFLHCNTPNVTAAQTQLDSSGHWIDSIESAVRIYRQAVEWALELNQKVTLLNTRGNHDEDLSMVVNSMLSVFWENEPRVCVLSNVSKFMHYQYKSVLITSHHGDKGIKPQRIYEYFTRTQAKLWGDTEHRYCHMGHIHHKQASEQGGAMLFESWNTLAAQDEYHSQAGYGSGRSMSAVIYSPVWGETQRFRVGITQLYDECIS